MEDGAARRPGMRMTAGRRAAMALLAVLLLLLLGVYTQRKPIARSFVDAELRARGVSARYRIATFGPGIQRLRGVVIGDPADPDAVADELRVRLRYRFGWPRVAAVEARGVRVRGRLANGKLSLGAIDRLLPPAGDAPFALPEIRVDLADVRVKLDTPAGAVEATIVGKGDLTGGFAGRIGLLVPRLATGGCVLRGAQADMAARIVDRQPRLSGPVIAAMADCGRLTVVRPHAVLKAELEPAFTPRTLDLALNTGPVALGMERATTMAARLKYDAANSQNRHGTIALIAGDVRSRVGAARKAGWRGTYRIGAPAFEDGARPLRLSGRFVVEGAESDRFAGAGGFARKVGGLPVEPVVRAVGEAMAAAARDFDVSAQVAFDGGVGGRGGPIAGEIRIGQAMLDSLSGAHMRLAGDGARIALADGAARLNGTIAAGGGGLPTVRAAMRQARPGAALHGVATVAPYGAAGGRLALTPVRFSASDGVVRVATVATMNGPAASGRVTGLTLPVNAAIGRETVANTACVPLAFESLAIAGMTFGPARMPLCPTGGAMLRVGGGRASGGVITPRPRLAGRVGAQPLTITGQDLRYDISSARFSIDMVKARLGGEGGTRLDLARLEGRAEPHGLSGRLAGADGAIANVPIRLSEAAGGWRLSGGRLSIKAAGTVSDMDAAPRFYPLSAPDIALELTGGVIRVTGTLREPKSGVALTDVAIHHDLGAGEGDATLAVPGITFGPAFQPEAFTRLTLGVVANVAGTVRGEGRIAWNRDGVTSSGDFDTDGIDLAAAFGPVTGIRTKLHFSDLLKLETPPGQIVTVAGFNPGIAVDGGIVGYQLLEGQRIAVGGGKWPFLGGGLILEPTVLDFGQPVVRRMTFRVEGMEAEKFVERMEFKSLAATGLFDGSLPMVFDERGGRIVDGYLRVREPGGTLSYVGAPPADLNMFARIAFDALKSVRYSNLRVVLDGPLEGEIVDRVIFRGTNDGARATPAHGLLAGFSRLPIRFNMVIRAPFRAMTGAVRSFTDPSHLIAEAARDDATPTQDNSPVKPPLSRNER